MDETSGKEHQQGGSGTYPDQGAKSSSESGSSFLAAAVQNLGANPGRELFMIFGIAAPLILFGFTFARAAPMLGDALHRDCGTHL